MSLQLFIFNQLFKFYSAVSLYCYMDLPVQLLFTDEHGSQLVFPSGMDFQV